MNDFTLERLTKRMTFDETFFYFLAYSGLGWLLENVYSFFTQGEFWKDGYLKGPFKPMYGVAPLLILSLRGEGHSPLFVLLLCLLVPTVVEYVSGYLLHALFGQRWWDYSDKRGQVQGYICMRFSLYWGGLSLVFLQYVHPFMEKHYLNLAPVWEKASPVFLLAFLADSLWTFRVRRKAWKGNLI